MQNTTGIVVQRMVFLALFWVRRIGQSNCGAKFGTEADVDGIHKQGFVHLYQWERGGSYLLQLFPRVSGEVNV